MSIGKHANVQDFQGNHWKEQYAHLHVAKPGNV